MSVFYTLWLWSCFHNFTANRCLGVSSLFWFSSLLNTSGPLSRKLHSLCYFFFALIFCNIVLLYQPDIWCWQRGTARLASEIGPEFARVVFWAKNYLPIPALKPVHVLPILFPGVCLYLHHAKETATVLSNSSSSSNMVLSQISYLSLWYQWTEYTPDPYLSMNR